VSYETQNGDPRSRWRALRAAVFGDVVLDLRHGIRALGRSPAFALVAVVTLALGIGAATAVFSVVNGVLVKPLPYPELQALVSLWNGSPSSDGSDTVPLSATQFFTYREENSTFASIGLWSRATATVTGSQQPEEVRALRVTHGTLDALAVPPAAGRWFSPEDDAPGSSPAVILSGGYWARRFGSDRSVLGRTLVVDGLPRTIVGAMPVSFRFLNETPDLILPFQFNPAELRLGAFNHFALGRLRPGATMVDAGHDVARMNVIWLSAWPSPAGFDSDRFVKAPALRPLTREVVGDIGHVLWVLLGAVGVVLLVACANVANLQLARAEQCRHELGVRVALGAGSFRVARGLLLESLLLGVFGGVLGLALTEALIRVLVALAPTSLPRLDDIGIDGTVLAFALAVSLASGVLFGAIPALRYAGPRIVRSLRVVERTSSEAPAPRRARSVLVVAQVSLALVLLIAAGLLVRTFAALRAVQPGFTGPDQIQLVRITIPETLVGDPVRVFVTEREIRDRVAVIPGVTAASLTSAAPMEPFASANVVFTEFPIDAQGKTRRFKFVSPGYFATVGTPMLAGRDFDWTDLLQRRPVAVISEGMAREIWHEPEAALGRRIRESPESPWREIVGVVGDVHDDGVHAAPPAMAYWPVFMERFEGNPIRVRRSVTVAIRSRRAGSVSFVKDIEQAVWAVNGHLPVARVQTLQDVYDGSMARTSFTLVILAIAASTTLLLGLVGVYGVIAYSVAQQTREIGIRVALGAPPRAVLGMFVRRGVVLTGGGVAFGVLAAVALTRVMSSLLVGVSPLDPLTYVAGSLFLIAASLAASYIPARKASAVDPAQALRAP
jgi:predicted permease